MGEVHLAHDELLQRDVAVKLLAAPFVEDANMLARFRREALASARLAHPNVVTTLDFGLHDDVPFIVMEFVSGVALDVLIHRSGPLPPNEVVRLAAQIARGLEAAHRQGVIHRDIKPGNVMVTDSAGQRTARIMDFGVAQAPTDGPRLTMVGGAVGTPGYVAPEQLAGDAVGPSADLYALGITMYEMLSNRLPWADDEPLALLTAALRDPPTPIAALVPQIPEAIARWVMSLIEREPSARPSDAAMVAEGLEAIVRATSGRDATTRPIPPSDLSSVVVASMSPEPTTATWQAAWFRSAVEAEGGRVAQSIRREVVALLPSPEATLRLTRSQPTEGTERPALALHLGHTHADADEVLLGPAVRAGLRLARLAVADEVLLTQPLHDALGLGWRARVHPRGELVLEPGVAFGVFSIPAAEDGVELEATLEAHPDGVHWRCPCSAHGVVPETGEPPTRLRCSGCSRLLHFRAQQFSEVLPTPKERLDEEHPLSSIVLTATPAAADEDAQTNNRLIDALSGFDV